MSPTVNVARSALAAATACVSEAGAGAGAAKDRSAWAWKFTNAGSASHCAGWLGWGVIDTIRPEPKPRSKVPGRSPNATPFHPGNALPAPASRLTLRGVVVRRMPTLDNSRQLPSS